jgi:hypothetical protein
MDPFSDWPTKCETQSVLSVPRRRSVVAEARGRGKVEEPIARVRVTALNSQSLEYLRYLSVSLSLSSCAVVRISFVTGDIAPLQDSRPDNRVRSIMAQLLCNPARGDPEQRILVAQTGDNVVPDVRTGSGVTDERRSG